MLASQSTNLTVQPDDQPRYRVTGRPITTMKSFQQEKSSRGGNLYLPVVKYPTGSYIFRDYNPFLYDPQSSTLLNLGKTMVFGSKIQAYIELYSMLEDPEFNCCNDDAHLLWGKYTAFYYIISKSSSWKIVLQNLIPEWTSRSLYREKFVPLDDFIETCMKPYYYTLLNNCEPVPFIDAIDTTPLYPTDKSKYMQPLYFAIGSHDFVEEPLLRIARALKIDNLIFQHELDDGRSVTEIMDARPNSNEYLVYNDEISIDWYKNYCVKYPTIWFPNQGYVTFPEPADDKNSS